MITVANAIIEAILGQVDPELPHGPTAGEFLPSEKTIGQHVIGRYRRNGGRLKPYRRADADAACGTGGLTVAPDLALIARVERRSCRRWDKSVEPFDRTRRQGRCSAENRPIEKRKEDQPRPARDRPPSGRQPRTAVEPVEQVGEAGQAGDGRPSRARGSPVLISKANFGGRLQPRRRVVIRPPGRLRCVRRKPSPRIAEDDSGVPRRRPPPKTGRGTRKARRMRRSRSTSVSAAVSSGGVNPLGTARVAVPARTPRAADRASRWSARR